MIPVIQSLPGSSPAPLEGREPPPPAPASEARRWRDAEILVALVVLWIASTVRVVGAATRHEVFGTEATLAFLCMFAVPWMIGRARLPRAPEGEVVDPRGPPAAAEASGARPSKSAAGRARLHVVKRGRDAGAPVRERRG